MKHLTQNQLAHIMNRTPISFFGDNSVIIYLLTQTAPLTSELLRAGYCNMTHYVWWAKKRKQNKQKERLSKYFSLNITLLLRAHASKFWGFLLCSSFFLSFFCPFKKNLSHKNARTKNNQTYQESRQFRVETQVNESIQELEALKYTCNVNKITSRISDSLKSSFRTFCSKEQLLKQSVTLLREL